MVLHDERQEVVEACQYLSDNGLVVGTAGNVSIRVDDRVVISPSGVNYQGMTAADVVVVSMDGTSLDGGLKPSSELPLHLAIYRGTTHSTVVHTHSPASTALSTVVEVVPASHYYTALFGGSVRVAPYARFGTDELAQNVVDALVDRTAALMSNHGAVLAGSQLSKVLEQVPYLEYICDVQLRAGSYGSTVKVLGDEEIQRVLAGLIGYGQESAR
ncbi:class II aldolase/adducin family protein [Nakamurella sp. UYEF19]|uniref:class II aldolase/adducin family protein n=1 Tax=Nakamurella sp. UYEF19 TaxID=1756392 RepID=UPI0033968DD2